MLLCARYSYLRLLPFLFPSFFFGLLIFLPFPSISLIFKQDSENDHIYHSELFTLTKRTARGEPVKISFTVPVFEPHPPQYIIRAISDSWLRAESFYTISFHNLTLPEVWIWIFLMFRCSFVIVFMLLLVH